MIFTEFFLCPPTATTSTSTVGAMLATSASNKKVENKMNVTARGPKRDTNNTEKVNGATEIPTTAGVMLETSAGNKTVRNRTQLTTGRPERDTDREKHQDQARIPINTILVCTGFGLFIVCLAGIYSFFIT